MTRLSRVTSGDIRADIRIGSNSGRFRTGLWLALLSLLAGCLVPQTVDPVDTRAHSPPRIQVASIPLYLLGPKLTMYRANPTNDAPPCRCLLELRIPQVVEDDATVDLTARWFVDYDLSVPRSLSVAPGGQAVLPGTFDRNLTVRGPVVFAFDADALGVSDGFHAVDVVVGETAGFDDSATSLPFRTMKSGYEAAVYRFLVEVRAPLPTCPNQLPLLRTCQ